MAQAEGAVPAVLERLKTRSERSVSLRDDGSGNDTTARWQPCGRIEIVPLAPCFDGQREGLKDEREYSTS